MFLFHSKSTTSLNLRLPRSSKTSLKYIPCCGRSDFARLETFRFWDEEDYTSTRCSQYEVLLTFELKSFWRENVVAVVILPRVLARMPWWREQVTKCKKFQYHFAIGRGLNILRYKQPYYLFWWKKGKMKLSGVSLFDNTCKSLS